MEKIDRRKKKTKKAIYTALNTLMQTKRYQNITVQEILDVADIGRTTFYAHFETKDKLLECYLSDMFDQFLIETTLDDQDISSMIPLEAIFDHIGNHNALLKNLLKSENGNLFFDRAREYWTKQLNGNLIKQNFTPDIPMEIFVENIVQSVITFIKWWLKNDCFYSAKEMTGFWKKANLL